MALITDRTHADCERARYLIDKVHAGETLTDAERAEYFGGLRGAYTMAHDWNRVESEVQNLSQRMGFVLETKTGWTYSDIATHAEIERYLGNVRVLANAVELPPCKIGDKIYEPCKSCNAVHEYEVVGFRYKYETVLIECDMRVWTDKDIGVRVFLTREEAEKALENLKNG